MSSRRRGSRHPPRSWSKEEAVESVCLLILLCSGERRMVKLAVIMRVIFEMSVCEMACSERESVKVLRI